VDCCLTFLGALVPARLAASDCGGVCDSWSKAAAAIEREDVEVGEGVRMMGCGWFAVCVCVKRLEISIYKV
jgi:hypothetical protein